MRVLVTGSSGFLGSHICEELDRRGHEVVGFDLELPPYSFPGRMILGDIRDGPQLAKAMKGCTVVYNCAAVADLEKARKEPREAVEVNILGTLSVIESAKRVGIEHLIQASSVYVYSDMGSVYRTTKQAAENLINDLSSDGAMRATILRFGSLYGPRADSSNAILRLVEQAVREQKVDFWGDGSEVREYIHIYDAAILAVDTLHEQFTGQSLHIVGNERITTRDLLEMIKEIMGGSLEINLVDESFEGRYRLTPYSYRDRLGRKMLGSTFIDLGAGLLDVIQSVSKADSESDI